jgi:magnesium-transporting ATPase (P-type)
VLIVPPLGIIILKVNKKYWLHLNLQENVVKSMSVVVLDASVKKFLLVKGAPESILERCIMVCTCDSSKASPLTEEMRKNMNGKLRDYGKMALRCILLLQR